MPKRKIVVATSYQKITPESAKEGSVPEHGWEDEEGEEFDTVPEVVEFLKNNGVIEASSEPCFSIGVWYENQESQDPSTGDWTTNHFHIRNATPEEEEEIYYGVFRNSRRQCAIELKEEYENR